MVAILRAVLSISAVTALSRATGYVRTAVWAAVLGTGVVANAYAVAAGLPTLIYDLFMGGILWSIFVPLLVERMTTHGEEDAQRLTNALLTLILPFLAVLSILGIIFAEPLVNVSTRWEAAAISPEEQQETFDLAVLLFRFSILHVFFYGIGTIGTGVLNAHRQFILPTFAPILNNVFAIACFLGYALLAPHYPDAAVYLLAATTLGVAIMSLILLPAMYRLGYRIRPVFGHPALMPAVKLAGPMLVFVAASFGLQFVVTLLSTSFFAAAQVGFAFVIFSLPYGVFVIALETALMPELSEQHARGDLRGYGETLSFGLRNIAFLMVPSTVGLIVLSNPIVGLLYERGQFTSGDTSVVADLLVAYSVGLLAYSVYFLLVRAFYSRQNTRTPALLNVGVFLLYAALAYGLSGISGVGVAGLALALTGTSTVFAIVALAATRREIGRIGGLRLLRSLARVLAAGAVMYAAAWTGTMLLGVGSNLLDRVIILTLVGSASLAVYIGVAFLLGAEELKSVVALFRRRIGKAEDQTTE
ncbi:MAG: murein biosynthesis integral membrane protein MurJ [Rubrobacteraceae bacterium]